MDQTKYNCCQETIWARAIAGTQILLALTLIGLYTSNYVDSESTSNWPIQKGILVTGIVRGFLGILMGVILIYASNLRRTNWLTLWMGLGIISIFLGMIHVVLDVAEAGPTPLKLVVNVVNILFLSLSMLVIRMLEQCMT